MDVDGAVKLMAKETILVVEDEEDIRALLKYNLEKEGYQVSGAATGEEALQAVRSHRPDLILLDLMLPGHRWFGSLPPDQGGGPDPEPTDHHAHRQGGRGGYRHGFGIRRGRLYRPSPSVPGCSWPACAPP